MTIVRGSELLNPLRKIFLHKVIVTVDEVCSSEKQNGINVFSGEKNVVLYIYSIGVYILHIR